MAQVVLFRALLRPVVALYQGPHNDVQLEGSFAVIQGAMACMRGLVEFIESLSAMDWEGFWRGCRF